MATKTKVLLLLIFAISQFACFEAFSAQKNNLFFLNQIRKDIFHDERLFDYLAERGDLSLEWDCGAQNDGDKVVEDYFAQKFDHFNETDQRTYLQRYMVNKEFYKDHTDSEVNSPIVFLMIGGEGEMSRQWVCWHNYTYMQLAEKHNAIVVQLEHRFFGKNKEMTDLSLENLQYLTVEQALKDITTFIPSFNSANNLTNARWVAFGGSYPGTLAAYLRLKYPEMTVGNVASSAPIWPKVNFWEYTEVMEKTIKDTDPSLNCYHNVGKAFNELRNLTLTEEGRKILTRKFKIVPPLKQDIDDINLFLNIIFGAFQGVIQYTYDARRTNRYDIGEICRLMNDNAEDLVYGGLVKVYDQVMKWEGQPKWSIDADYQESIEPLHNISLDSDYAASRAWLWMCCNEFGWWQTTDVGGGLFGDIISLGSYFKLCIDVFGDVYNGTYNEEHVRKTRQTFGDAESYKATNVVLPNGAFDPWSALGVSTSIPENHQLTVMTPGAAHCSDMYPHYDGEPEKLKDARDLVVQEVDYYLKTANSAHAIGVPMLAMFILSLFVVLIQGINC